MVRKIFYSLFLVLLLINAGCSVQKNTGASRAYHNLTSHYNIFFNARESYKSGIRKARKQLHLNYNKLLPVFPIDKKETANVLSPEMDRVIKKVSKLITYHSITAKPKQKSSRLTEKDKEFFNLPEYNKWVDDSYLLMGKAQYMKNDLESALTSFNYIINTNYPDQIVNFEARLWIIKTYDRTNNFRYAEDILTKLKNQEKDIPSSLIAEYHAVLANHYLLQKKITLALPELRKVFEFNKKKNERARFAFLLGQLYEETEDHNNAIAWFKKVFHLNPPYEMAFNAHIRIAEDTESASNNLKEIKKDLRKLLRDTKNKEYRDQIYYAFGKIALKEGKENQAIDYFKKSTLFSVSNDLQKGLSFLSIADLYFNRNDYKNAQIYYDSTVTVLPANYPGFSAFKNKSNSLNGLVRYTEEITLQDSLQHLAAMPKKERLVIIDKIIEQVKEQERKEAEQNMTQTYSPGMALQTEMRYQTEMNHSGKWYFYNPTALGFGRSEFKRRWGNRKLEDNWRRKNKATISFETNATPEDTLSNEQIIQKIQKSNKKNRSYYLRQIPLNDSMMVVSNKRIQEGLFESSLIFSDELKDDEKAISNLERLVKDYPESSYLLAAYYNLYQLYKKTVRKNLSEKYKNLIISKFPDSKEAKILSDPLYLQKLNEQKIREEKSYEEVYHLFNAGNYEQVIKKCDLALRGTVVDDLKSKYMFLRAVSLGKVSDPHTFKNALKMVVDSAKDKQIVSRAKSLISYLNKQHPILKQEEIEKIANVIYHFSENENHLMTLFISGNQININQLKFEIINYNTDRYPQTDFEVKVNRDIYHDTVVVMIRSVGKYNKALNYLHGFNSYNGLGKFLQQQGIVDCLFSKTNFEVFLKNKSLPSYLVFYKKYYLR